MSRYTLLFANLTYRAFKYVGAWWILILVPVYGLYKIATIARGFMGGGATAAQPEVSAPGPKRRTKLVYDWE